MVEQLATDYANYFRQADITKEVFEFERQIQKSAQNILIVKFTYRLIQFAQASMKC